MHGMSWSEWLSTLAIVLALFSLTIFVHEFGHFWVARRAGMVVKTFSIGFGPAIWRRRIRGVEWRVGAIPFGGYVALPQMDVEGSRGEEEGDEPSPPPPPISPGWRLAVALAGAMFNLLLAYAIGWVIFLRAGPAASGREPVVGYVETNSPAWQAGLRLGDRILRANGHRVRTWDDVVVNAALADEVELEIERSGGERVQVRIPTQADPSGARYIQGVAKSVPCLVIGVVPGSPAEAAGIQRRDLIVELDGRPVLGVEHFIESLQEYRDRTVTLTVLRGRERHTVEVRPVWNESYSRAVVGVQMNTFDLSMKPAQQIRAWAAPVFRLLKAFGTRAERGRAARSVGGPVEIFRMYWMAAQTSWLLALWLTGMLNVNLAILNLLPIPVLDGGHAVWSLFEILFRRPMPARVVAWAHRAFALALIVLFTWITVRDVRRWASATRARPAEAEATTNAPGVPAQD